MRNTPPHNAHVDLSTKEAELLQQYAETHGISIEDAATQMAQEALVRRYGSSRMPGARVVPFVRRH